MGEPWQLGISQAGINMTQEPRGKPKRKETGPKDCIHKCLARSPPRAAKPENSHKQHLFTTKWGPVARQGCSEKEEETTMPATWQPLAVGPETINRRTRGF